MGNIAGQRRNETYPTRGGIGPQGAAGAQGPQGAQGAAGAQGPQGDAGAGAGLIGTYAARPAPGVSGRAYWTSDGAVQFIDTGAIWVPSIAGTLGTEPTNDVATTFPDVVGAGATVTDFKGAMFFDMASDAGTKMYGRVATYTPSIIRTVHVRAPATYSGNTGGSNLAGGQVGIVIAAADPATLFTTFTYGVVGYSVSAVPGMLMTAIDILDWTDGTTISGGLFEQVVVPGPIGMWLQYEDDNVNQYFRMSTDGFNWVLLAQRVRNVGFTPTRVGVGGAIISTGTMPVQGLIDSYSLLVTP